MQTGMADLNKTSGLDRRTATSAIDPINGVFDFLAYLENEDGGYVPLAIEDGRALKLVESWLWWQGQGKKRSIEHLMEQRAACS